MARCQRSPIRQGMKRTLDLGCGSNKRAGAIGADITRGSAADVIVNLEQFFYPYNPGVLEHRPEVAEKFQKIEVRLTFNPLFRRLGIEWLANIYPELYESFWAFIFPARNIVFRLKVIK